MKQLLSKICTWMQSRLRGPFRRRGRSAVSASRLAKDKALVGGSGLFDGAWYLSMYPDVGADGVDPLRHYLVYGAKEGRDPGPFFSSSGYRFACQETFDLELNPLLHYLASGKKRGWAPLPFMPGAQRRIEGARTVLVCGHLAGKQVFGAERSMLDVLSSLGRLGCNVLVSLPAAGSADYLAAVRELAVGVWILPYGWWRNGRPACQETVDLFCGFMREQQVDLVLLNTIVLFEPAVAARQCGIPVVIHAREIPEHDPDLCDRLCADPPGIRKHVLNLADRLIVNSPAVGDFFAAPERTTLVPDCISSDAYSLPVSMVPSEPKVGLISSNLPKKGLADFVEMARLLNDRMPHLRCLLIGPENEYVRALREAASKGELPENLVFAGYAPTPLEALMQVDVLVNLSTVQESFGRTVLEAMLVQRPVVCYDWGGLGELVVDNETGYLVPFRDVETVAKRVAQIFETPGLYHRLAQGGRLRAVNCFSTRTLDERLQGFFKNLL